MSILLPAGVRLEVRSARNRNDQNDAALEYICEGFLRRLVPYMAGHDNGASG